MHNAPSFADVSRLLHLAADGSLQWKVRRGPVRAGAIAGHLNADGYLDISIGKRHFLAHRVVWLLSRGNWPDGMIDHIDRDKTNNRPDNLRLCNKSQNSANQAARPGKFKGVTVHTKTGLFQAQCGHKYVGLFRTAEEAAHAYDRAAVNRYGEYAHLNFPEVTA